MSVLSFLTDLEQRQIRLWADGDQLRCNAPVGVLTPLLRGELKQRKEEILAFLRAAEESSQGPRAIVPLQRSGTQPPVFAVPGHALDPQYSGCNELIAKGHAKLVTSAREVMEELGIVAMEKKESRYAPQNDREEKILQILTSMPQPMDDLVAKSKLDPAAVSSTLTMMELAGAAKNVGGGQWVRG